MVDCMSVCVYNLALESHWGGGGDAAGVFALAAIQHSTFLSDIQYYDLKTPAQQRNTHLLRSSTLQTFIHSCHLRNALGFFYSPSFHLLLSKFRKSLVTFDPKPDLSLFVSS